jgi:glycosyltransferase involved in cell wall biosynthesis
VFNRTDEICDSLMKHIIFYHPHPIVENPSKGSELRPKKMKEAFEKIGYQVDLAVGDSKMRKAGFKQIKNNIQEGKKYDFMYGESSNMPIPITDSHHFPVRPFQDFLFFKMLSKHSITTGFFYRDIFWQVKKLRRRHNFFKTIPKQIFHWIEWYGLKYSIDHLFLPSDIIARYLPTSWPVTKRSALYPGCMPIESVEKESTYSEDDEDLKLFYVGGIEPTLYNLEPLLQVVSEINGVHLKLCCRKKDWDKYSSYYKKFDLKNIEIIHANSSEIGRYYGWADLVMCLWTSKGYINITMPIKIIETIGYEVPLILLEGSESAELVRREDAGWVVNSVDEAKKLLETLRDDKEKIKEKVKAIQKINQKHTWEQRAKQASKILTNLNSRPIT